MQKNAEGHHTDYNKPLSVVWLCRKHHKDWHKTNKAINGFDSDKLVVVSRETLKKLKTVASITGVTMKNLLWALAIDAHKDAVKIINKNNLNKKENAKRNNKQG